MFMPFHLIPLAMAWRFIIFFTVRGWCGWQGRVAGQGRLVSSFLRLRLKWVVNGAVSAAPGGGQGRTRRYSSWGWRYAVTPDGALALHDIGQQ